MERVVREYVQRGHINISTGKETPYTIQRVAAYCRVSTNSDEQLNSYAVQVKYYTEFIQSKPEWEFVGIYADEGITGTSAKKRKDFMRMIADAMAGKIDVIIVKSVSRFARNTVDSLSTVRDLREKGVKVFFEKENIDSLDAKCDMILSIYSSLAGEESHSISTNIRWSVQKRFENGQVIMCFKNLYGYSIDKDKKPIILESEAEVVREIYFKFLLGYSFSDIVNYLSTEGVLAPKGGSKWSKSTINSMLSNEKYVGDALLQKTYKRDFLTQRRVKNTGQAPQKYVENNHPAIVDRKTWNAVQAELQQRNNIRTVERSGKGRFSGQYAFSGMIECGECGAGFRRHNYLNNNKVEYVWSCKQHISSKGACSQLPIKEKWLEAVFVKTLNGLIQSRTDILDKLRSSIGEAILEVNEHCDGVTHNMQQLDKEIECLQERIMALNKRRQRREIDAETYNTESSSVMNKMDELFKQRDEMSERASIGTLNKLQFESVEEFIRTEQAQKEFDKDVFIRLVKLIKIRNRKEITFELKNGLSIQADTQGIE